MPVTIGSVGDIIAICILVKDCVEALSETNGSAAEYQAVIRELYVLEKALLEVGTLSRSHTTIPELIALFASVEATVDQSRQSLTAFKAKTKRYENYLGTSSTKSHARKVFAGSAKKLLWQVQMKDDVSRFRAEVVAHSMSINQLLAAATMHNIKAQADRFDSRILDVQQDNRSRFDQQDDTLKQIRTRLDDVNRRISAGNGLLGNLVQSTRTDWFMQLGQDLKASMSKTMMVNLAIYASINKLHSSVLDIRRALSAPDPLMTPLSNERIFYLEDAIGRVSTITLNFITSWDALTSVLEVRFQGVPGLKKVRKKEYALQNRATGRDVDVSQHWESVFLPGLWFDMSMIFRQIQGEGVEDPNEDTCPRCQAKSNQPQGLRIRCSICKQIYQRVSDLTAETNTTSTHHTHAPEAPSSSSIAMPLEDRPIVHPVSPSGPTKGEREADPDEDPANYNHVRIMKKRRLNRHQLQKLPTMAKRQVGDTMDIHSIETPSTRDKHAGSTEGLQAEGAKADEANVEEQQEDNDVNKWTSSPQDFKLNKASKRENPSSFPSNTSTSSYQDSQESSSTTPKQSKQSYRPKATKEDAHRAGIPAGYSYKDWDPEEEPIFLLSSVFDANSLGKWIYDWTVFHSGSPSLLAETAGELWALFIQVAGRVKRAEETMSKIARQANRDMIEDFLESGERLWGRFAKLSKICEDYMWKSAMKAHKAAGLEGKPALGENSGRDFVDSLFGRDRELEKTEKLMTGMRLWVMRFDSNCDDILRHPSA